MGDQVVRTRSTPFPSRNGLSERTESQIAGCVRKVRYAMAPLAHSVSGKVTSMSYRLGIDVLQNALSDLSV